MATPVEFAGRLGETGRSAATGMLERRSIGTRRGITAGCGQGLAGRPSYPAIVLRSLFWVHTNEVRFPFAGPWV